LQPSGAASCTPKSTGAIGWCRTGKSSDIGRNGSHAADHQKTRKDERMERFDRLIEPAIKLPFLLAMFSEYRKVLPKDTAHDHEMTMSYWLRSLSVMSYDSDDKPATRDDVLHYLQQLETMYDTAAPVLVEQAPVMFSNHYKWLVGKAGRDIVSLRQEWE
jgi:hypothetical protein